MVAPRRLEGLALPAPLRAPRNQPAFLDPAVAFLGVLAVDIHIVRGPALWRASRVREDAPGIGDPDAAHEGIEEDRLVKGEVWMQEEELGCIGEEADQQDNTRNGQAGESWVEHWKKSGSWERRGGGGGGGERRRRTKESFVCLRRGEWAG